MLVTRDLLEARRSTGTCSCSAAPSLFIRLLVRTGMLPYVIYRLLLGTMLFVLFG